MTDEGTHISYSLEADEDWPVADIWYNRAHWASMTLLDGQPVTTTYDSGDTPISVQDAIAALEQARQRLLELTARS